MNYTCMTWTWISLKLGLRTCVKDLIKLEALHFIKNLVKVLELLLLLFFFFFCNMKSFCMFSGTVIRDESGLTLENAHKGLLGTASKVVITKDSTLIVTDGNTQEAVKMRVSQLKKLVEV